MDQNRSNNSGSSSSNGRCPLCNKALVIMAGTPTCPTCGYRDIWANQRDGDGNPIYSYGAPSSEKSRDKRKGNRTVSTGAVVGLAAGFVIFLMSATVMLLSGSRYLLRSMEHRMEAEQSGREGGREQSPSRGAAAVGKAQPALKPKSELLCELAEDIFGKPLEKVTQAEMDSVILLIFYRLGDTEALAVEYQLIDGTTSTCFPKNTRLEPADLKYFRGLEWLQMDEYLSWNTDWGDLKQLRGLSCKSSLSEIASAMDASQLVWVKSRNGILTSKSGRFDQFTNLEYLEIENSDLSSLEGISELGSLKKLVLKNVNLMESFEELYDMPQLESLYIESPRLRDIGFVREMPGLRELGLVNTQLKHLDAIEDCADTLEKLYLERNNYVEDYSVVFECKELTELELYVQYDFDVTMQAPDLSGLPKLKKLHLGNYDHFDELAKLTQLEELTLEDASCGNWEAFASLKNLKRFHLIDMSVYRGFLEVVPMLEELEFLDMTDSYIWDDISVIFGAPKLRSVTLKDATAGLIVSNMVPCESLAELDMTGVKLKKMLDDGKWDYKGSGEETKLILQDTREFFDAFPGLQALAVPGQELEDVEFLADKKDLFYLDVSDNYITDLSPLAKLPGLKVVICEKNPLHNREGLDNVVLVEGS